MEKLFEAVVCLSVFAVGVPLVIILAGWALNVVRVLWLLGDRLEKFICKRIDAELYAQHERLRKEIDGD